MLTTQFSSVSDGIFGSKLSFGIQVFGNVWGMPTMDDENRRFHGFSKEDNRRLQVLQNKVMRLKSGADYRTPTVELIQLCREFSVQQVTAYHSLMTVFKAVRFGKPSYLVEKWKLRAPTEDTVFPHMQLNNINVGADLTLSRGGLVYRGA